MKWTVPCPAKLNLFLSVGPIDERGWHPLRTRFQCVSLFDFLTVEIADEDSLSCNVDYVPVTNTVTKALELLRQHYEFPPLRIQLDKAIPAQSGLGGGSSDGAGLLRLAVEIIPNLDKAVLAEIALKVGADVPFFLVGGRADATGYGEKLTPLPDGPIDHYVIVKPPVSCSTPEMFKALDALSYPFRQLPEGDELYNDFERVMPCDCGDVIELLLARGARDAGLSGSGSAVFGRFLSEADCLRQLDYFRSKGFEDVWACRSLARDESIRLSQ